jgi:hypothetical protein
VTTVQRNVAFIEATEAGDAIDRPIVVPEVQATALSPKELETWSRLRPQLLAVWYDADVITGPNRIVVDDSYFPLRLLWVHNGLSLSIPAFATGTHAPDSVRHLVRDIIQVVESDTNLTAYDPQTGRRFQLEDESGGLTTGLNFGADTSAIRQTPEMERVALIFHLARALIPWVMIILVLVLLAPQLGTGLVIAVIAAFVAVWVFISVVVIVAMRRARAKKR